jgi:hypothetical protein
MYRPSHSHPHTSNQHPFSTIITSIHNISHDSEELDWLLPYTSHSFSHSQPFQLHSIDSSITVVQDPVLPIPFYLACSLSNSNKILYSKSSPPQPFYRLPKASTLPDLSQFSDPYPLHPPPPIPQFNSLLRRAVAS